MASSTGACRPERLELRQGLEDRDVPVEMVGEATRTSPGQRCRRSRRTTRNGSETAEAHRTGGHPDRRRRLPRPERSHPRRRESPARPRHRGGRHPRRFSRLDREPHAPAGHVVARRHPHDRRHDLGTSRVKPHRAPFRGRIRDVRGQIVANCQKNGLDAVVCIGGDGTQKNAFRLLEKGSPSSPCRRPSTTTWP